MSSLIRKISDIRGMNVTVMGLGLNGGGLASARFFSQNGAMVTVTDLRGWDVLAPSIKQLENYSIRYVLGKHDEKDFSTADIVIKNPGVRYNSPFLQKARHIETDISIFLSLTGNRIIAVTGSKGKSTTVSAVHAALRNKFPNARLGGNITVSPLSFINEITVDDPVVLELSSWQLADLRGRGLLKPEVCCITNIYPDHQNMYSGMDDYVADKRLIYADQDNCDYTVLNHDDSYSPQFASESKGRIRFFSDSRLPESCEGTYFQNGIGVIRTGSLELPILPESVSIIGNHLKKNLLAAAAILYSFDVEPDIIRDGLSGFTGIEHRLEPVAVKRGVAYYNDSAATIPHAVVEAIRSMVRPVHLICGGTDKNLDFEILTGVASIPQSITLLAGTATDKIIPLLSGLGISFKGPFNDLSAAVSAAAETAVENDTVLLSPGCASFGLFLNEFDRGNRFKEIVNALPD